VKRFISDQLYRLSNLSVRAMPRGLLKRLLRVLHTEPGIAARAGYQVYPDVFYNPFPSAAEVDLERLKLKRSLPGIQFDIAKTQAMLAELAPYAAEVKQLLAERPVALVEKWGRTYPPGDSAVLYAMLRRFKPKRYIEVGCGFSSRVSTPALLRNADEGHRCEALYIEPYPPDYLAELKLPGEFLKQKIQQVPLERFKKLRAGDVLFIDTSHVIKTQNDVEYELLQVLPSLNPGVIIHVHDIFTPYDYPEEWLVGNQPNRGGNNEQYALECLLSGGNDWEVMLPTYLLWKEHASDFNHLVRDDHRPASFWIRKNAKP
jgi:hypothetical protein